MKHIKLFENTGDGELPRIPLDGPKEYSEAELQSAIRFAVEKYTNYHQAMSHQEMEKTFNEWKDKGEYYETH